MKQSKQDLVMVTGILALITAVCFLGVSMPSQVDTAQNIKDILTNRVVLLPTIAQK